tara:strand:- start:73 stop:396 length:324 start_codon:yes stop_codon:yes gene_type:complete
MKIKYPLKSTYQKPFGRQKQWCVEIQFAPKDSLQAKYSLMSNYSLSFYAKTKEECKEWVRKFKADKRYIEKRKQWRSSERYYSKKENQEDGLQRLRKLSRAFSQMGF